MGEGNKVKAAMTGALTFLKLRDEVEAVLVERLHVAAGGYDIEGHQEAAERIILLFAELLDESPPPAPPSTTLAEGG